MQTNKYSDSDSSNKQKAAEKIDRSFQTFGQETFFNTFPPPNVKAALTYNFFYFFIADFSLFEATEL